MFQIIRTRQSSIDAKNDCSHWTSMQAVALDLRFTSRDNKKEVEKRSVHWILETKHLCKEDLCIPQLLPLSMYLHWKDTFLTSKFMRGPYKLEDLRTTKAMHSESCILLSGDQAGPQYSRVSAKSQTLITLNTLESVFRLWWKMFVAHGKTVVIVPETIAAVSNWAYYQV